MAHEGEAWRLGRLPALDGLRGIAVLLVVASHVRSPWIGSAAGDVGVTVFFTLSGFLIATLLCQELEDTGRVSFRRFYERRARRLLPALFAVVIIAVAVTIATGIGFVSVPEVFGTLTYSTNLVGVFVDLQDHGMLHHTWSLVIEEQFYLVWPLLTMLLWRRRRLLLGLTFAGVMLAAFQRVNLWGATPDFERLAYSVDTRVDGILIGCGLALLLRGRQLPVCRFGGLGLLWIAVFMLAPPSLTFLFGLSVAGLASALVILAVLGDVAPRWLEWGPLQGVGRVSYGLYLWHHLVLVFSDRALGFERNWVATALIMLPFSAVLTWVSWRYLEQPWLRHRADGDSQGVREPAAASPLLTGGTVVAPELGLEGSNP